MSVKVRPQPPRGAERWLNIVFGTSSPVTAIDAAVVAARIVLAWVFIYYGAAKLFGWFGGAGPHGLHDASRFFADTAHLRPGGFFAVLGGLLEFGGGIAMALGFFTRLTGLALFGDMVMAMITVTWATGINSATSPPGYQLNIVVAVLALMLTLIGGGRYSLDALIVRRLEPGQASVGNPVSDPDSDPG